MQISKSETNCLSDSIAGISALSYGGTLNVALLTGPLAANDQFTLFSATAYAGVFVNLNLPAPGTGLFWDTSALSTSGTIGVRRIDSPTFGRLYFIWDVSLQLRFSGTPGLPYSVWATTEAGLSSDPGAWVLLDNTRVFDPQGAGSYEDPYVLWFYSQRFYRISCP